MIYLQYIIPAAALIIVQLIISTTDRKATNTKLEMTIKEIREDITRLEKKQDRHNELIERVTKLEMKDDAQWKWIDQFKTKLP